MTTNTKEQFVEDLISHWGDDPQRSGLEDTPKRFLRAMEDLTSGYQQDLDAVINGALFDSPARDMVIIKNIELHSLCEHHLLPFSGHAHVGYLPNGKVLGLSKVARIVDHFAKRLQIQETLTQEIAESVAQLTGALGVGVVITAEHLCMKMRGIAKQESKMTTSSMLGQFRDRDRTRAEFLSLIR